MEKKYVSSINNNNQQLFVRDQEAHQKINDIKTDLDNFLHYIGESQSILSGAKGPWNIDQVIYNVQYFEHLFTGDSPALYIRNKNLDKVINDSNYYAYNLTNYPSSFGQDSILYIKEDILDGNNSVYKIDNTNVIEIPSYTFYTYHNIESGEINLKFNSIAIFKSDTNKEIEYIFGTTGWSKVGSQDSKILFPSMEFEPFSGELVISDEDIEDNFNFDYTTGELIFNP